MLFFVAGVLGMAVRELRELDYSGLLLSDVGGN